MMITSAQLINQTSGKTEYYTPQPILDAACALMDGIDLDPASSQQANTRVRALKYFTKATDGLDQDWSGKVWMNHPFGRNTNNPWVQKLESEFAVGRVTQACCITFACTSEAWFRPLLRRVQCFLVPRTNYILPSGELLKGVTKGSVVTYYGQDPTRFIEAFKAFGVVKGQL